MLSILAFPFHVIASLLRYIFGRLHISLPTFPFSSLNFYRPIWPNSVSGHASSSDPYSVADRWVRALEDETGALCVSHAQAGRASDNDAVEGVASSSNVGSLSDSTGLRTRYGTISAKVLPDFMLGSYEDALQACQREVRIGCIILVSDEHDDVLEFKRNTLTDPTFVDLLHTNNFVVWGGDVRDKEGWAASQKLQATTYPFVAFVSLQPPRGFTSRQSSTSSNSTPSLTILSRHQGASATLPHVLSTHISTQLLPRITPFLERIRNANRERDLERRLRAEQDAAFAESARRDREKIEMRVREEKAAEEAKRLEEEKAMQEEERKQQRAQVKRSWRKLRRGELIPAEAKELRMGIRLGDGERLMRGFAKADSVTALHAFVDAHLVPAEEISEKDEAVFDKDEDGEYEIVRMIEDAGQTADEWWGFKLFTAYPRREVAWTPGTKLAEIPGLEQGGQLVVEMVDVDRRRSSESQMVGDGDDSDGYETE